MPFDSAQLLHILQRGDLLVAQDAGFLSILYTRALVSPYTYTSQI